MLFEVRIVVTYGLAMTGRRHKGALWGAGFVLFLHLNAGCMHGFTPKIHQGVHKSKDIWGSFSVMNMADW